MLHTFNRSTASVPYFLQPRNIKFQICHAFAVRHLKEQFYLWQRGY